MQAGGFVGADDDLAAWNALHLGQVDDHLLAGVDSALGIVLKGLAGGSEADFASGAVEELGPDLILQGANLGRDGRLRAKALFRCAREAGVARYFEKCLYLVEIHS